MDTNVFGMAATFAPFIPALRASGGEPGKMRRLVGIASVAGIRGLPGAEAYSASKAASDHLAMAWHHTYGLPVVLSNCSNNYGPYHFPEKLVPLMIINGLEGKSLPVYGTGENVRDWLHVEDHARALALVVTRGRVGQSYNIGGRNERSNLKVVETIADTLDELVPLNTGSRRKLITFVGDRPGHDLRYAIDAGKIERDLGWKPRETFATGLRKTVQWYLDHPEWVARIRSGSYRGERLGLGAG